MRAEETGEASNKDLKYLILTERIFRMSRCPWMVHIPHVLSYEQHVSDLQAAGYITYC